MEKKKPLLIAFEGLMSYWPAGYVRHGLVLPLAKLYPEQFDYQIGSWLCGRIFPPSVADQKERPAILVFGHSFGGITAARLAAKLHAIHQNVFLITGDPRMKPPAVPAGLPAFNFYQQGNGFSGFEMEGATNILLPKSVTHTAVPAQQQVRWQVEAVMGLHNAGKGGQ